MPQEVTRPPVQMLRDALQKDSPLREASVSRLIIVCAALGMPFVLLLGVGQHSFTLALGINGFLVMVMGYHLILQQALKRGWFHPLIPWANVFLEVSIPGSIIAMAVKLQGPGYAVMTPAHILWGGLMVVSAIRARPWLSLMAGGVACLEWFAIYFLMMVPELGAAPPVALRLAGVALRGVCLMMAAGFGALFAGHFVRKAEEALSTVREQDLMGKYFLHERIGSGGMAEVYRATYCPEGGFQKPVAIKRVLPEYARNEAFSEMFREEARLCAMLAHPNIVQVFDCGKYNDGFMLAMEYVDGLPLNQLLKRLGHPLPLSAVAFLGVELSRALDYIHKKVAPTGAPLNLVHRDVNPPNILISRIGEVKLADFGVANAATRLETGRSDVFYGKLHYAAPEQLITAPFDGRADLFALGLTLNEALTQRKVYGVESDSALNQGIFPRIPRPSELRPDVPPELDALVMALCEIDRERRPPSGSDAYARFAALTGPCAPFPAGQQALARAVEEALARGGGLLGDEPGERATEVPGPRREEPRTPQGRSPRARKATPLPASLPSTLSAPPLGQEDIQTEILSAEPPRRPR